MLSRRCRQSLGCLRARHPFCVSILAALFIGVFAKLLAPTLPPPAGFDQPDEAAAYFQLKRLPQGMKELPVERYEVAKAQTRTMPRYSTRLGRFLAPRELAAPQDLGAWSSLGPGNIGGRTRALLIHPNTPDTMYAAGVTGGVWKTTNGGAVWTPISDLIANLAVSTLALVPGQPEVIYAGTGESFVFGFRGNGIFKTTDGGANWAQLAATANNASFRFVNKLALSQRNPQRVYAATDSGVFRSLDGGVSWSQILNQTGCGDLVIRTDQDSDYLFTACRPSSQGSQGTIFRNTDAGGAGAWTQVHTEAGMARVTLALAPSSQNVIYALAASGVPGPGNNYSNGLHAVFRSTSNGDPGSWTARVRNTNPVLFNTMLLSNPATSICNNVFIGQGHYDNIIAVDPADPNRVWAGGVVIFRSDDGGANWGWTFCGETHADYHLIAFHPQYNGTTNKTMFIGNDGGLFKTADARANVTTQICGNVPCNGLVSFTSLNNSYGVTQFYHGLPYPDGRTYFGGTQDNGTVRGTDATGANNWSDLLGGDGGYVAVDPNNTNILYAESQNLAISKSTNGGANFTRAVNGINNQGFLFIVPFQLDPVNSQRLWTGGAVLWRTSDGAANWTQASAALGGGSVSAIAIATNNSSLVLAGTSSGFIHRTNAGTTADANTVWPSARPRNAFVSWLAYDPVNPNIAYATYSGFNLGPTDRHVYKSTDGGVTWIGIDGVGASTIPDVPVHCIVVDPANTNRLYVGTDIGVFASVDGGTTWAVENTGFANAITEALAINPSGPAKFLFAFTHGRGAWRVNLNNINNCAAISLNPASLLAGAINAAYNQTLTASGGAGPHTFAVSAGALPAGLALASNGALSGTPAAAGSFNFTVKVTDAAGCTGTGAYALIINCQSMAVGPTTLPAGIIGAAYSQQLSQTGGIGAINFSVSGALPAGLTLSAAGLLAGTPTTAGAFIFTARATDSNGCTGTRTYQMTVNAAQQNPVPALSSLAVNAVATGTRNFTLVVSGTNFIGSSVLRMNGADRPTTVLSLTQLRATLPDADLAAVATANVTVFNPTPGGGVSNALVFRIVNRIACVSAASFRGEELAPEAIIAAFGVNLATGVEVSTLPLPTTLLGTTLRVRDSAGTERLAQLFFVSSGQLNFLMPPGTAPGAATITIIGGDGSLSLGTLQIASAAPGLFSANANGQGVAAAVVLRVKADGSQSFEAVTAVDAQNVFVAKPIDLGPAGEQLFLLAFGTGFRFNSAASARLGGVVAEVSFAGAQGDLAGLDQANIAIPRSLGGRGEVDVSLSVNGKAANPVRLNIK